MCDTIHLPPGPLRAVNRCHRLGAGPARCAARAQLPAMAQGGSSALLVQSRQCGSRYQLGPLRRRALGRSRRLVPGHDRSEAERLSDGLR
jgi:hypothetical protein